MKRKMISVAIAFSAFVLYMAASSMVETDRPGYPMRVDASCPGTLADLLSCPNRIFGHYGALISGHWCFFAGDTEDFNDFLERYADLDGISPQLILHPGRVKSGVLGGGQGLYDWQISVSPRLRDRNGTLDLWVDGQVELEKIRVPANVKVVAGGENDEIAEFVATLLEERKATNETADPAIPAAIRSEDVGLFKSKRLLYGKVALTEDEANVLSVLLDESGGTRTGYDVLYADTNFNGRFEESERFSAAATKRHGTWLASSSFAPINLSVPYNKKAEGIANPCQVSLGYLQYPRHGVAEEISVTVRVTLRGSDEEWGFAFSGGVKPAKSLEKASIWAAGVKPTLGVFARPDGYRKGNLGLGLNFAAGENKLECWKAGQPLKAQVVIRKPGGETVHSGEATPDKLSFG